VAFVTCHMSKHVPNRRCGWYS